MKTGPSSHRYDFDFVNELASGIEGKKDQDNSDSSNLLAKCPHVRVIIGKREMMALLDSGSQVSAVSEVFYRELILQNRVRELPVTIWWFRPLSVKNQHQLNVKFSFR